MHYLIDGHNLIPKLPGFSLKEIDDELHLVEWLQPFCRIKRKSVDVFFDQAAPGHAQLRRYGMVTAHFVRQDSTADAAIQLFLLKEGKMARNICVVSSDHVVINYARTVHAMVISSEEFSRELIQTVNDQPAKNPTGKLLSEEEITYWENIFNNRIEKKP